MGKRLLWALPVALGLLALLTLLLHLVERRVSRRLSHRFGWRSVLVTGWLGVPLHELSHLAMCWVFRHRIVAYRLFDPDPRTGTLVLLSALDNLVKGASGQAVQAWNAANPILKRGLSLTPVKFGISFTSTHLNQGGALIHVYRDGSVHLNHGGTEMGQGLFIKIAQVVADELGVPIDQVRLNFNPQGLMIINAAIGLMMLGVSLDLELDDFKRVLVAPKAPAIGLVAQFLLLPALTFLLILILRFIPSMALYPSMALGMILVAACSGRCWARPGVATSAISSVVTSSWISASPRSAMCTNTGGTSSGAVIR